MWACFLVLSMHFAEITLPIMHLVYGFGTVVFPPVSLLYEHMPRQIFDMLFNGFTHTKRTCMSLVSVCLMVQFYSLVCLTNYVRAQDKKMLKI